MTSKKSKHSDPGIDKRNLVLGIDASNLRTGGGVRHLEEVLSHANFDDHKFKKIIIWTGCDTKYETPRELKIDIDVRTRNELSSGILKRIHHLHTKVRTEVTAECDVIFAPGGLPFIFNIPNVTMFRNMLPFDEKNKRKLKPRWKRLKFDILKIGMILGFRKADATIFLNDYALSYIESNHKVNSSFVVPHGISDSFDFVKRVEREYSKDEEIRLLYVSTFHEYKNHMVLIEAFRKLLAKHRGVRLRLVGAYDSSFGRKVVKYILEDPSLSPRINVLGVLKGDDLVKEYASADIFVYPSSCENMPNILLEAMKSKLPIACSKVEPMLSILGEGGLYFDPNSSDELADKIARLIESREIRMNISNSAYANSTSFSWNVCARNTMQILHSAASTRY